MKNIRVLKCFLMLLFISACKEKIEKTEGQIDSDKQTLSMYLKSIKTPAEVPDLFQLSLEEAVLDFKIPALQSPSVANYDANWVLIGGRENGLHSMDNDPPAFNGNRANDSIWVVNLKNKTSFGVPVPDTYARELSATSQQSYQVADKLYLSGGFTRQNMSTDTINNWTSDTFFEIDLPSLIAYVESQGSSPAIDQVFTKVVQSPFLQVTGGEMMVVNNNFYIIGGQNYQGTYSPGNTGTYTNAIRKFNLTTALNNQWQLSDTLTLLDTENLHRRDFNMTETVMYGNDSIGAVIYGGVFTKNDLAYRNPVYINGMVSGKPIISLDTSFLQKTNLYASAKVQAAMLINDKGWLFNHTSFLGGISYLTLKSGADSLTVPDVGNELPFSNVISSFLTDGEFYSLEKVQLPPQELLPTYLGTNAIFFPVSGFALDGHPEILDINKIFADALDNQPILIGYMLGGIVSSVPNTMTPNGHVSTSINKKLYKVFMTMKLPGSN